jgi:hypothetical protein
MINSGDGVADRVQDHVQCVLSLSKGMPSTGAVLSLSKGAVLSLSRGAVLSLSKGSAHVCSATAVVSKPTNG